MNFPVVLKIHVMVADDEDGANTFVGVSGNYATRFSVSKDVERKSVMKKITSEDDMPATTLAGRLVNPIEAGEPVVDPPIIAPVVAYM